LCRSTKNRAIAGVAAGLAEYFNLDATVLRVGFVAASLLGLGGPVLYVIGWAVLPEEGKESSIASDFMRDKPWEHWWHQAPPVSGTAS
jgi:phage shock protein PspC (stress-responsive transcriptional regulator)